MPAQGEGDARLGQAPRICLPLVVQNVEASHGDVGLGQVGEVRGQQR